MNLEHSLQNYIPVPESGCWLWLGGWNIYGYGKTGGNSGSVFAHRIFYRHFVGEIPAGMLVCHKCDTPACVNPSHLFVGTVKDNAIDREQKNRGRYTKLRNRSS